jgi:hypothetical protein
VGIRVGRTVWAGLADFHESLGCVVDLPDDQDDGPKELDCDRDTVGSSVVAFTRCVVDNSR